MTLTLQIIGPAPDNPPAQLRHTFDEGGGGLGRDTDNAWVLPHSRVSAHHAVISSYDGVFYIEDQSTNGTCLNSPQNRLPRNRPQALSGGDYLFIGPYEIEVSIKAGLAANRYRTAGRADPFSGQDPFESPPAGSEVSGLVSGPAFDSETVDPIELLGGASRRSQSQPVRSPVARDLDNVPVTEEHFEPPGAVPDPTLPDAATAIPAGYDPLADPGFAAPPTPPQPRPVSPAGTSGEASVIPHNYDPLATNDTKPLFPAAPVDRLHEEPERSGREQPVGEPRSAAAQVSDRPASLPEPVPVAPHGPDVGNPPVSGADLATILAAVGVDPAAITPETARQLGAILRVVVTGVMELLRSRQQVKDELRMRLTQFKPAENNPLKFSANVEDALHNLFVKRNAAYMPPVDAFEDAFSDLRGHQLAMLAGIRAAFEALLADFDPDRLQSEFDRHLNIGLVPARLRYWDLYRERVAAMQKDRERTWRGLFDEEFARAYEDQFRDVKKQDRDAAMAARKPEKDREF